MGICRSPWRGRYDLLRIGSVRIFVARLLQSYPKSLITYRFAMTKLNIDIIDPIDGWLGRLRHGPMHRFTFLRAGDFSGIEVEHLLRGYGIRVWGREVTDSEEIALLVKRKQAVWAEYLLCRAGVPLTTPLLDPRNARYSERHPQRSMPTPWTEHGIGPHSLVDHIVDWLNRLL